MADIVNTQWLYPPNWDGNPPEGQGWNSVTVRLQGKFGVATAGESLVQKVDISELRTHGGLECTRTKILRCNYNVQGMSAIELWWDRAPQVKALTMLGEGKACFEKQGGLVDAGGGGTGDILLSTIYAGDGAFYDITLRLGLKEE